MNQFRIILLIIFAKEDDSCALVGVITDTDQAPAESVDATVQAPTDCYN